ncbi:unnamed protein product [Hymenolepis diminuta]|uniref:Uncharacterized protein n=1 Tax=Hymenolepis diminuta TaxID=6216 RepID=A0A564YJR3_HYMDI|nr:unnamed protein product [Hymenolepis diminuta]
MLPYNCSEVSNFLTSCPGSSFRLMSSFLKSPAENHLQQVFSFTTFPFYFHKCL